MSWAKQTKLWQTKLWGTFKLVLLLCLAIHSSEIHAERLPVKIYTTADGLARDQINRIVQDSHGFLWFCTVEGLSRFDGYRFTNYTTANGLPSGMVNDLLETRDGTFLVATTNGLCRFNPRGAPMFTTWRPAEPGAEVINELIEDRAGRIWCGTNAGLYWIDTTSGAWSFHFVDLGLRRENFDSWLIDALIEDKTGALWVGTRGNGLCRYRPDGRTDRFAVAQGLPTNRITALLEDSAGQLWVGTPRGVCQLTHLNSHRPLVARVYTVKDGLTDNWVTTIFQSREGKILVGSRGYTEIVNSSTDSNPQLQSYTTAQGLSVNSINAISEDRDGNLWLGTDNGGAIKIARNGFKTFGPVDGLADGEISSLFQDQSGQICAFIRDRQGNEFITHFEERGFASLRLHLPMGLKNLGWGWGQQAFQDKSREWWAPTGDGLYRFQSATSFAQLAHTRPTTVYSSKNGLVTDDVFTLFEDSRGDVWIGSISPSLNGMTRWKRSQQALHTFTEAEGLPSTNVLPTAFGEDQAGNVWVGFNLAGLARYDSKRFTVFNGNDGAPRGWILAIYCDRSGRLWVSGGQDGVSRIDDPKAAHPTFVHYTVAEGLSSNQVNCITEDQWGRLYFGTGRGLDRLDPATGRVKHFTSADGLVKGRVRFALRDRSGTLWFANNSELSRLVPEPDPPQPAPPILIERVQISGVASPLSELGESQVGPLKLSAWQNQVSIDFVSLEFDPGEVLRYQHRLEGADRDWSTPSEQRVVDYESLAPGSYRFLVRAVTAEGVMSLRPAVVAFTIPPPYWRRWWFVTLGVLLTCSLIYTAHRYRVTRLIELERVRTRIATDLHDDIGSSLSRMAILSEVAKRRIDGDTQESASLLTDIAESARVAVNSMSDIVWAIDPRRDDLSNVIFRVRQFAADLIGVKGLTWHFDAPAEVENIKLSPEQRRHVFLIFKEAINNAVRHAECTSVNLSLAIVHNQIVAEIRDNGRGFAVPSLENVKDNGSTVHGLWNLRTRATQLGGHLEIDSSPHQGTCVRLTIPLKRHHGMNMPWLRLER